MDQHQHQHHGDRISNICCETGSPSESNSQVLFRHSPSSFREGHPTIYTIWSRLSVTAEPLQLWHFPRAEAWPQDGRLTVQQGLVVSYRRKDRWAFSERKTRSSNCNREEREGLAGRTLRVKIRARARTPGRLNKGDPLFQLNAYQGLAAWSHLNDAITRRMPRWRERERERRRRVMGSAVSNMRDHVALLRPDLDATRRTQTDLEPRD